jgi:hypothetical protein
MIKCLYGGCPKTFVDDEIKQFVSNETFLKFKKFKISQIRLSNVNANYINCPFPDCENIIESSGDQRETKVECQTGHQFCTKCKTLGWHVLGKCKKVFY